MFRNRPPTAAAALAVLLLSTGCTDDGADRSRRQSAGAHPGAARDTPTSPGGRLAQELGCGACHADLPGPTTAREGAPAFGDAGRSYEPGFLLSYLRDPGRVRADIGRARMPDFHLSEAESLALSLFILDRSGRSGSPGSEFRRAREAHPGADVELGRRIFRALNCAGCHRGTELEPWPAGPSLAAEGRRARAGWLEAWLADPTALRPFGFHPGTGSRMPDFRLTEAEVDTLARYLQRRGAGESEAFRRDSSSEAAAPDLTAFERQKARALLRDRHSCLGCHRLEGRGGRIGPALDGVAERRPGSYLRRVVAHPDSATPGTVMPRVPMTAERRRLLVGYLAGLDTPASGGAPASGRAGRERSGYLSLVEHPLRAPTGTGRARAAGAREPPTGGALYRERCASCHGTEGAADGYNARYLPATPAVHASADSMSRRPDDVLFDGIWAGGRVLDRSHRMPPFGGSLTREQTWSLVDHIRELCDCRGPDWARGER